MDSKKVWLIQAELIDLCCCFPRSTPGYTSRLPQRTSFNLMSVSKLRMWNRVHKKPIPLHIASNSLQDTGSQLCLHCVNHLSERSLFSLCLTSPSSLNPLHTDDPAWWSWLRAHSHTRSTWWQHWSNKVLAACESAVGFWLCLFPIWIMNRCRVGHCCLNPKRKLQCNLQFLQSETICLRKNCSFSLQTGWWLRREYGRCK